jgi:hypothetical protein
MENKYEKPSIDVQKFDVADVITESSTENIGEFTTKAPSGDYGDEI